MSGTPEQFLTRRRLLGAAGSAAAVSLASSGAVHAEEESETPPRMQRQRAERNAPRVETIPATNPAYEYYTYSSSAFAPLQSSNGRATGDLGATVTSGLMDMSAPVTFPVGTVVQEMTVWASNTSGALTFLDFGSLANDVATTDYVFNLSVNVPDGQSMVDPLTSAGTEVIQAGRNYFLNFLALPGRHIKAVRLGVTPAALSYRTVTPGRVHDSRPGNGGGGPLATGLDRIVSVAERIDPVGGAVVENNFVPAGARAVSLNVTAVNTVGNGYFVVNPGGNSTVTASSVNWTAGQTVANGIVCALSGSRQLTVIAGGSGASANFIIDITGYYL
jgi:hypothetical protein